MWIASPKPSNDVWRKIRRPSRRFPSHRGARSFRLPRPGERPDPIVQIVVNCRPRREVARFQPHDRLDVSGEEEIGRGFRHLRLRCVPVLRELILAAKGITRHGRDEMGVVRAGMEVSQYPRAEPEVPAPGHKSRLAGGRPGSSQGRNGRRPNPGRRPGRARGSRRLATRGPLYSRRRPGAAGTPHREPVRSSWPYHRASWRSGQEEHRGVEHPGSVASVTKRTAFRGPLRSIELDRVAVGKRDGAGGHTSVLTGLGPFAQDRSQGSSGAAHFSVGMVSSQEGSDIVSRPLPASPRNDGSRSSFARGRFRRVMPEGL